MGLSHVKYPNLTKNLSLPENTIVVHNCPSGYVPDVSRHLQNLLMPKQHWIKQVKPIEFSKNYDIYYAVLNEHRIHRINIKRVLTSRFTISSKLIEFSFNIDNITLDDLT